MDYGGHYYFVSSSPKLNKFENREELIKKGLGKKEKYVLICCSICISTFAVNLGLYFDKWAAQWPPAPRDTA